MKFHHTVAVFFDFHHSGGQFAVTEDHFVACLHLATGLTEAFPLFVAKVTQKQYLHCATGGAVAQKAGRQNTGVVHHQAVTRLQIIDNIVKMFVLNLAGHAIQLQHPRGIPLLQGGLSDQFLRKIEPKVGSFQYLISF